MSLTGMNDNVKVTIRSNVDDVVGWDRELGKTLVNEANRGYEATRHSPTLTKRITLIGPKKMPNIDAESVANQAKLVKHNLWRMSCLSYYAAMLLQGRNWYI